MNLRAIRKMRGYTQKELAQIVGVSDVSMSNYERGTQMPDLTILTKIADTLCVSTDELLGHNMDIEKDEAWAFREQMRNNPSYRILFSAADKAKPEHLRAAAAVLQSLKGDQDDDQRE